MKLSVKLPRANGLLFLAGLVFLALAIFQFSAIPAKRRQLATAENDLVIARQKSEKLGKILSEVKMVAGDLEMVRTALPAGDDVPTLITELEQVAKESGVSVQHLGFGEGKKETAEGKITLTAVVSGSYSALQTFLQNLETISRVVNVTNFRFSPTQKTEGEPSLSITLGLEAFYLVGAETASSEAPLTLDTSSSEYLEVMKKVKELRVYRPEVSE